ncbi:MAG: Gfo/Idh/MocA family protein [Halobacteriaceae archaeon]
MAYRVIGANFDQMHIATNLQWVADHPDAELVGVCDEDPSTSTGSMAAVADELGVPGDRRYDDLDRCIEETDPDLVVGCPKNSEHADFVERVAAYDVHVTVEKPLAVDLADADRMLAAMDDSDGTLFVNWPVTWDPVKHEVKRLVEAGTVGDVLEVQYYGGNAGAPPDDSWFYDPDAGGGSLMDYLGYGATFSTWFRGGELPESVTAETYVPGDMDVDVQSASVARYEDGLSTLQTSWRMFTHPWETEPQPPKGYELVGTEGTISTRERGVEIRVQTEDDPEGHAVEPEPLEPPSQNLIQYVIHCIENGQEPEGPTDPAFCREAQRIVDTAKASAEAGGPVDLLE